jgi:hypothetical protein
MPPLFVKISQFNVVVIPRLNINSVEAKKKGVLDAMFHWSILVLSSDTMKA